MYVSYTPFAKLFDTPKFFAIDEIWEVRVPFVLLLRSGHRQRFASAGTATADDLAAIFALHPLAETMCSFTLDTAWLISTFRHLVIPPKFCADESRRLIT